MPDMPPLTPEEAAVIENGATEAPFSGKYTQSFAPGTYICRRCSSPLYQSSSKFDARCGWPSFDDVLPGAVKRLQDKDKRRTELRCQRCAAHLGHVFLGEQFTATNTRHCVNSLSLRFIPSSKSHTKKLTP